jgi:CDP-paratose 2-epimerase
MGEAPSHVLVTGGAGFIGSNLSDRLLGLGHRVTVYDALSRPGVARNLDWLKARHGDAVTAIVADVRDGETLARAASEADAVFHMAAQVAVTTSMVEPMEDFEINVRATVTLLDALRRRGGTVPLVFASTNKVYGDLADVELGLTNDAYVPADPAVRDAGIGETRPLDFHTP